MLNLRCRLFSTIDFGNLVRQFKKRLLTDVHNYWRLTNDLSKTKTKPTNGPLTDRLNLPNNRRTSNRSIWLTIDHGRLTNHFQQTRLITSSTEKHYSLHSDDDCSSGCRNVSHQQQFFSQLLMIRLLGSNHLLSWCYCMYIWRLVIYSKRSKNAVLHLTSLNYIFQAANHTLLIILFFSHIAYLLLFIS